MAKKTNFEVNGNKYFRVTRTIGHKSDGTLIRKFFYGKGINEANEKADEYMNNLKTGMSSDYNELDINQLVHNWLFEIKANDSEFKPGSFSKYEGIYRNYIKDSDIGYLKVFSCKTIMIKKYYNKLSEKGKTESQIKNLNKVLKGAFNYAIQEGYTKMNPCQFVTIPKTRKDDFDQTEDDDIDFFSFQDIEKIIAECNKRINEKTQNYLPYLILFSIGTGLRQGEALGLQSIYFSDYITKVRKELCKVKIFKNQKCIGYEYKLLPPKTPSSIRDVDTPMHVFDIINMYIETIVKPIYKINNKVFDDSSLIFVNSSANHLDQSNLQKNWESFLKEIGVQYKKWHTLRASFATLLFLSGADIKTVQVLLGHANINTTIKIYLKVFPETKKNAVNLLNEKLK